jgi:tetratricopeptide (TPR) repeat protein
MNTRRPALVSKPQLAGRLLGRLVSYTLLGGSALLLALLYIAATGWSAPAEPDNPLPAIQKALDRADFTRARDLLAKALKDKPDDAKLLFLSARTARRADAFEEAEKHLKACDRLKASAEGVALERTLIRAQSGDPKEVEGELAKEAENGKNGDANLILEALGRGNIHVFRFSRALEHLNRLLDRAPDNIPALMVRARIWDRAAAENWGNKPGRHPNTVADYRRVVELDPEHYPARLGLANALDDDPQAALKEFEHLRKSHPKDATVLVGLARCRIALGEAEEARKLVEAALEKEPKNATAMLELARIGNLNGEPAKAEPWLRKALEIAPVERMAVYTMAQCLAQLGKEEESKRFVAALQKIEADTERLNELLRKLNESTEDPALYHDAGVVMLQLGQTDDGLHSLHHALLLDGKHRPTHAALADYYEKIGKKDLAAEHWKKAKGDEK